MHSPKEAHLKAIYKILRYLKHYPGKELLFKKNEKNEIEIFGNADWAGVVEDRRSITYYCTFVWENLVT